MDDVIGSPAEHLASATIMYRREEGYSPDSGDRFWAKYLADGSLDESPEGEGDYLFTTDADLN